MLTNRCSFKVCRILKEHGFPQSSLVFDSDYYDDYGNLHYNIDDSNTENLIFAPYVCEVIDRFEIDLDLYLSVYYSSGWFQYRIYDLSNDIEIVSDLKGIEMSLVAYEQCILKAIEYYDQKRK